MENVKRRFIGEVTTSKNKFAKLLKLISLKFTDYRKTPVTFCRVAVGTLQTLHDDDK